MHAQGLRRCLFRKRLRTMARSRLIPDKVILDAILDAFLTGGDKAVSFRLMAARVGLSAPALLGRFGSGEAMLQAGLAHGWSVLIGKVQQIADAPRKDGEGRNSGIQSILKQLSHPHPSLLAASRVDAQLAPMAENWRGSVVALIESRNGDREAAEMIFAAWSARDIWAAAGGKGFRLGAMLRRLN